MPLKSDILNDKTAKEMRARRPDMIYTKLPDRGHIPFWTNLRL